MSTFFDKLKISFGLKKPEPWYKKILKKSASVMDMKRRNKFITFFVLLFIAIYFCLPSVESIIKRVVHQYGSQIIGTDVSIGGIDLELSKGIGVVKDIKIANPKGYQAPNLFYLKELGVEIDISSLTSDTIIIDNITINNPEITYEMKTLTQSNISDILNNIEKNTATDEAAQSKDNSSKSAKDDGSSKKVIIKQLTVSDGKVAAIVGAASLKAPINISLPTIKMNNIGQDKNGATPVETISKVITKIMQTVSQTVVSANLSELKDASVKQVKAVADNLKAGSENIQEQGKAALGSAKNAVSNLKGMFK